MNHIVIGAGIPFLVGLCLYRRQGGRVGMRWLVTLPVCMALCAFWALIPDIPLLLGDVAWYVRAHRSPWIDVFFFHGSIDALEQRVDLAPWNWMLAMAMPATLLAIAWRELALREKRTGHHG